MFRIYSICILIGAFFLGQAQEYADMTALTGFSAPGRNHGMSVGDFNNDGLDDIYVSRREGPNRLYINSGGFAFEERSADFGIDYHGDTNCSLWWDYDNDGDLDLYLGNKFENTILFRNDGNIFTDVTQESQSAVYGNLRSLNAADIDNDGDLDLYIALAARQNVLLLNDGKGKFTDVTLERGIDDEGSSMGAVFFDYDHDGWIDLYQTRDGNQGNLMYRNLTNGYFKDASDETRTDLKGMGMGVDVAYINDDEFPDLYVSNLYDNFLLLNNGNGRYVNLAQQGKVNDRGMGWGTFVFDANNDSYNDIYVANESDFPVDGDYLPSKLFMGNPYLVFNSDDKSEDVQNMYSSYGAASGDFDGDGLLDIVVANQGDQGNQMFRNLNPEGYNYVKFKLHGVESNSMGIGSRITIYHEEGTQSDILTAGSGYASQNSSVIHFGLGTITQLDSVVVTWPSGIRQSLRYPSINQLNVIEEAESIAFRGPVVWTEPSFPSQNDSIILYFNAKEGNKALSGFDGPVFAHAGLITNKSTSPTDWKNVIGNWGTFDTRTLMKEEGDDIYSLEYNIKDFHDIQPGTIVEKLAFVFRNVDGTIVGRDIDGSDIYLDVSSDDNALLVNVISPNSSASNIYLQGEILPIELVVNREARIIIEDNSSLVADTTVSSIYLEYLLDQLGEQELSISVSEGGETQSFVFDFLVINGEGVVEDPPQDSHTGLNYKSAFSYVFRLDAPGKKYVFLLCPENDYSPDENYRLKKSIDGNSFWIELPQSLFLNGKNTYQYLVDGNIVIADPFSEVVLDPNQDQQVASEVRTALPDYPDGMTNGIVTAFDIEEPAFDWQVDNFVAPDKEDLIIYELLIRDFLGDRRYTSLTDTLDYLQELGVNAIELMPIQEFEGNDSWGYNPSFHMAVDKYYGSREELKRFIDESHKRGIAVILDVVFNHCFSQSPLAQLYWNSGAFRPSEDSPYLNVTARHPFNVGYDFNHESEVTKQWVKRVLAYWIEEFRFDGFRFDLSKGMTQTNSGNDAGLMSQYDASRIAILKDYADYIWSLDSDNYVILEHFADNSEEKELSDYGMMLWGNMNHQFNEAVMGFPSDLEWTDYKVRGWNDPHVVAYMESHDEERLMYRSLNFGNSEGDYSTRTLITALDRIAAAMTLFMTIPGPKMIWQFGEMGYDFSINRCSDGSISNDCRLVPKPIKWTYLDAYYRARLKGIVSSLAHLKREYETFSTEDYNFNDGNFFLKTVHLNHPEMDAVSLVNFRVTDTEINPKFPYTGTWYEFFSGDSLMVTNVNEKLPFKPGEYRIYTSKKIVPASGFLSATEELIERKVQLYPNPVISGQQISVMLENSENIEKLELISIEGQSKVLDFVQHGKIIQAHIPDLLPTGYYLLKLADDNLFSVHKIMIQ